MAHLFPFLHSGSQCYVPGSTPRFPAEVGCRDIRVTSDPDSCGSVAQLRVEETNADKMEIRKTNKFMALFTVHNSIEVRSAVNHERGG